MTAAALTDPQRRLLATIGQHVPAERVRELYLFAPMRQGGVETGLAVVAAGEPEAAPGPPAVVDGGAVAGLVAPSDAEAPTFDELLHPDTVLPDAVACTPQDPEIARAVVLAAESAAAARLAHEQACDPTDTAAGPAPPGPARFTVYTARYRLQLKGPDRGKWEAEVVAEADAPLVTVDVVVRGVQRRAGESTEVERLTGADFLQLLADGS